MKILFIADLHIKLGQKLVPVSWSLDRYTKLFDQLYAAQNNCDMLVIGGDIFDKLPDMAELEVYFALLYKIRKPCFIYSGNHEAVKKNTTFLTHLKEVTKVINPLVTILDDFYSVDNIDFIPYNKLKEYHPSDIDFHGDILCTHVRGEIPPHVKPEVPLSLFDRWKVVLAGDLHSYDNSQLNILYPGSPITTSFHRTKVRTGYIVLDTETLEHQWIAFDVPQMLKKTVSAGDTLEDIETDDLIVYDIEGNVSELAAVKSGELNVIVDKKIVTRRMQDSPLILTPEMTIVDEINEYLLFILGLSEEDTSKCIKELTHYVATN